ncbi:amino acid adenylation domain-containing protein [Fulvivirga sp. 29W222]|uniref:Amino acid adenylation domain-containing protein n=1 Tax=Fulvivirga marina TaxID=2494733 RepID=A0A937G2R6_9BACT|nr:non-ribosomal peptide synthetase [Fulvivirga marina]MBL6449617.1 amino acid adenylation domain-containing protein [Fulvivirga marina]
MQYKTLIELISHQSTLSDKGVVFIEGDEEKFLSYRDLLKRALTVLTFLQSKDLKKGDELIFQIDDNESFIILFWASILGGIIPVPLTVGHKDEHKRKVLNVWNVLSNPFILISSKGLSDLGVFAEINEYGDVFKKILTRSLLESKVFESRESVPARPDINPGDIAFIQFSSGSTGTPKGVTLTHHNLLTNIRDIGEAAGYTDLDSTLSWMPLTHDMGLIGFHLNPLLYGMNQYLIHTNIFIRRPSIWMDKASKHRITILCSPNFGYRYLLKHMSAKKSYNWDLSSVRLIYNGAEPISEELAFEFIDAMERYQLSHDAMCPVYGLAEASLAVSISDLEDKVNSLTVSRGSLGVGEEVLVAQENDEDTIPFVNVGRPIGESKLKIANRQGEEFEEGYVGHVFIKGENVTSGYYNNPEVNREMIINGWLNTGDTGFYHQGNLYIIGRSKDIIFVNGQNYYPHDLERVAEGIPGVELNKIVVSGYFDSSEQKDIVLVFVLFRGKNEDFVVLAEQIRKHLNLHFGFEADYILPVREIPKTTSGKLQRFRLVESFRKGDFAHVTKTLAALVDALPSNNDMSPPETELEEKILSLWKQLLPKHRQLIGTTTRFFEAGGNSLTAFRLLSQIQELFGFQIDIYTFFKNQTIRQLAGLIETTESTIVDGIIKCEKRQDYPLSSYQKRLYYAWAANKDTLTYNIPLVFKLNTPLEKERLRVSLEALCARHPILKASFGQKDGIPLFFIRQSTIIDMQVTPDVNGAPEEVLKAYIQPFDLERDPLFRVRLIAVNGVSYLFIDVHHSICDGLSLNQLVRELITLYDGHTLSQIDVDYTDFVIWEKERLRTDFSEALEFFKEKQEQLPSTLNLFADRPRPAIFDSSGKTLTFELGTKQSRALKNMAMDAGCSLNSVLFAAYALLLSKYSGQDTLCVGIPVHMREHMQLPDMAGMFVNSVPVVVHIDSEQSFEHYLESVTANILEVVRFARCPFEKIVDHIQKRSDASRNPLFDTMFVLHHHWDSELKSEAGIWKQSFIDSGTSKFDISLHVFDGEENMRFSLEYATALFDQWRMEQFASHFRTLLGNITKSSPKLPLKRLSSYSAEQENMILEHPKFQGVEESFTLENQIHHWFEKQARQTPDHVAIRFGNNTWSFNTLSQKSDELAEVLRELGVEAGKVALFLDRSPEFVIAVLGVLKAGATFIPLDTQLPEERVYRIVEDSECELIFSEKEIGASISSLYIQESTFGDIQLFKRVKESVNRGSKEEITPAYIIYTSGTTGNPKGVKVGHVSLINYVGWGARSYIGTDVDVAFPLFTSISFDLTLTSLFIPLVTGNEIVIYQDNEDDILIERIIEEGRCNVIKLTPAHLKVLTSLSFEPAIKKKIKRFIVGGERLDWKLSDDVWKMFGEHLEIYNEYGPTEATVGCMIHKFDPATETRSVPIGVPISNTTIYLLDTELQPVPKGVHGELYIGGKGLALGYHNNPASTAEKFIENPFEPGTLMYKTGDVAVEVENGVIEYINRIDNQVKINGYRIELAEIEYELNNFMGIRDALVHTREGASGAMILDAYYLSEQSLESEAIKTFLASRLPHYMIPLTYTHLDFIPLTKNGKVDYNALKPGANTVQQVGRELTAMEALILPVYQKVLNTKIGVDDNFFAEGGDSIKAVQISAQLRNKGLQVTPREVLSHFSVAQLSPVVSRLELKNPHYQELQSGSFAMPPIISWFFNHNFENVNYYNQSVVLNFKSDIQIEVLSKVMEELIRRHDGLRLNYNPESKQLFYNNSHLGPFDIPVIEIADEESLADKCQAIKMSMDLKNGLLFKAVIFQTNNGPKSLFLTAHHLVVDGVSWRILLEDLQQWYQEYAAGMLLTLSEKTAPVSKLATAFADIPENSLSKEKCDFWAWHKSSPFKIPCDFETSDWSLQNTETINFESESGLTNFLVKEAFKTHEVDARTILNTALVMSLCKWLGLKEVQIEQEGHGRTFDEQDFSRTCGWFTSIFPTRFTWDDGQITSILSQVKSIFNSITDGGIGYVHYQLQNGVPHTDLTEFRFNFLGIFDGEFDNDTFKYAPISTGLEVAPENHFTAKIEVNALIVSGVLTTIFSYNKKAFSKDTVHALKDLFEESLALVVDHLSQDKHIQFRPEDFEMATLEQEELDDLFD